MPPIERQESGIPNPNRALGDPPPRDPIPLALLNDFLYCPRRAALKIVEGWRESNEHTVQGEIIHDQADLPGYEVAKGVLVWRALPVWSERLGLSGKCDIVEAVPSAEQDGGVRTTGHGPTTHEHGLSTAGHLQSPIPNPKSKIQNLKSLVPVEYKKGKRRRFENDDAQLCAQALCLEEMFGVPVPRGAIFHAESKRRREVEFTPDLRRLTESAVAQLDGLLDPAHPPSRSALPKAQFKPACEECSLFEICLPKVTENTGRLERARMLLFQV